MCCEFAVECVNTEMGKFSTETQLYAAGSEQSLNGLKGCYGCFVTTIIMKFNEEEVFNY